MCSSDLKTALFGNGIVIDWWGVNFLRRVGTTLNGGIPILDPPPPPLGSFIDITYTGVDNETETKRVENNQGIVAARVHDGSSDTFAEFIDDPGRSYLTHDNGLAPNFRIASFSYRTGYRVADMFALYEAEDLEDLTAADRAELEGRDDVFYSSTVSDVVPVNKLSVLNSSSNPHETIFSDYDLGGQNVAFFSVTWIGHDYIYEGHSDKGDYRFPLGDYTGSVSLRPDGAVGGYFGGAPWNTPQLQRFTVYVEDAGNYSLEINMSAWGNANQEIIKVVVNDYPEEAYAFASVPGLQDGWIPVFRDMFDRNSLDRPEFYLEEGFNTFKFTNWNTASMLPMSFKLFYED